MQLDNLDIHIPFFVLLIAIAGLFYMGMPGELAGQRAKGNKAEFPSVKKMKLPPVFALHREPYLQIPGELGGKKAAPLLEDIEADDEDEEVRAPRAPAFHVSGTFINEKSRWAYIDGQLRAQGEVFAGTLLEKVLPTKVILRRGSERIVRNVSIAKVWRP